MHHTLSTTYLDNAAGTHVLPTIQHMLGDLPCANPSSLHQQGREAAAYLTEAREKIACALHAAPEEIIFTSSGTESCNLAVIGAARGQRHKGNHILVLATEHPAVCNATEALREEGFEIETLPVLENGVIDISACMKAIRKETILLCIQTVNNETGVVQPINTLHKKIQTLENPPLLYTDACQTLGLTVEKIRADLITLSAGKLYGPKGAALLYTRKGTRLTPLTHGGHQEHSMRAGTENVPAIYGFAEALTHMQRHSLPYKQHFQSLRKSFFEALDVEHTALSPHDTVPHIIHVRFPKIEGESLVLLLDQYGICCSTGSACSSLTLTPSHVLRAMNVPLQDIHGMLRVSTSIYNTQEELVFAAQKINECVRKLTAITCL